MSTLGGQLKGLNKAVAVSVEKYQNHVASIQYSTLNAHHKLISEVRAVLKTLAKVTIVTYIQIIYF